MLLKVTWIARKWKMFSFQFLFSGPSAPTLCQALC